MRVHVYPADPWACGHYRMVWPALAVQQQESSIDVTVIPTTDPEGLKIWANARGEVSDVDPPDTDVMVLQRPTIPLIAAAIPLLRAKGIAVVVDIDDDLAHIHPDNPAWRAMHPKGMQAVIRDEEGQLREGHVLPSEIHTDPDGRRWVRLDGKKYLVRSTTPSKSSWRAVTDACAAATLTTVSTPGLLSSYGRRGHGRVLYNYVPEAALKVARQDSAVIGWAGSTHSHPGDLGAMRGGLPDGARFMVVGNGTGADRELGLAEPVEMTGQVDFPEWPQAVAQLGVGVAPLVDSRFNAKKSWLKPLEYSAVGVPWVASPRAEYARLAALGIGALAEKPREWVRELRRLTGDDAYRRERSDEARAIAATLTIQEHAWRWATVWAEALKLERDRRPGGAGTRQG